MNTQIDESAQAAGRDPFAVRRLLNVSGRFTSSGGGLLVGPPAQWAEELAEIALTYGISAFILMADDAATIELFATEVAPSTRELVVAARAGTTLGLAPAVAAS